MKYLLVSEWNSTHDSLLYCKRGPFDPIYSRHTDLRFLELPKPGWAPGDVHWLQTPLCSPQNHGFPPVLSSEGWALWTWCHQQSLDLVVHRVSCKKRKITNQHQQQDSNDSTGTATISYSLWLKFLFPNWYLTFRRGDREINSTWTVVVGMTLNSHSVCMLKFLFTWLSSVLEITMNKVFYPTII